MLGRVLRPVLAVTFVALAVWQLKLLVKQFAPPSAASQLDTVTVTQGTFEVGFTREGVLNSPGALPVKAADQLRWRTRLTYVVPDASKVKKGDLLAKLDVADYRNQVDSEKRQYQQALQEVGTAKRDADQAVEQAEFDLKGKESSRDIQGKSSSVDTELKGLDVGLKNVGPRTRAEGFRSAAPPQPGATGSATEGRGGAGYRTLERVPAYRFAERPGTGRERESDRELEDSHRHRERPLQRGIGQAASEGDGARICRRG